MAIARRPKVTTGRHVALLRGLNVGGANRISMADLAAIFAQAGAAEVTTLQAAGNVLLTAAAGEVAAISARVEAALKARGLGSTLVLRTREALLAAAAEHPFLARGADAARCYVAFLAARPTAAAARSLEPDRSPPDAFELRGRELYLWLPGGAAGTRVTNAWMDSRLGTVSTVRGWKTVQALAARIA
jgi:uncharacterized protein (DUF1697 family)